MALITCPSCGANVSDKAIKCPKCGTSLIAPPIQAEDESAKSASPNNQDNSFWVIMIVLALVFSVLFIIGYHIDNNNKTSYEQITDSCAVDTMAVASIATEPIVYTRYDIHDMYVDCKDNFLRAKDKYLGKHVEIIGKLERIYDDEFLVGTLEDYFGGTQYVKCSIDAVKESLKNYNIDDQIMIKGEVDEIDDLDGIHILTAEIVDKNVAKAEGLKKYKGRWIEVLFDNAAAEDVKTFDRGIRLVLRKNGTLSYVSILDMRMVQIGRNHVNRGEGKWKIKTINGSPCIELTRNANTTYIKDDKLYNKEWHYLGDIVDAGSEKDADESSYFKEESKESTEEVRGNGPSTAQSSLD